MKDICYGCEVVQEYGTMRDIEETRFNIYCDACLIKGVDMTDSKQPTLYEIALVKSYAYCEEYNTATGRTEERNGARFLKEGFVDGFLAGFAHKIGGGHGDTL